MDLTIAAILALDGITTGAVYALLALCIVLVFSVTRVIFIPQGEFVAYGALTMAALQAGKPAATATLLLALGALTFCVELYACIRQWQLCGAAGTLRGKIFSLAAKTIAYPVAIYYLCQHLDLANLPMALQIVLTLLIVVPMGPFLYRLAYQTLAEASVLVLLIVSVGVHFTLVGLGLVMFGAEGSRTTPFSDAQWAWGGVSLSGQSAIIVLVSLTLICALYLFFEHTLAGKALRATAVNRLGARLMGISSVQAGRQAFTLAAGIGALSGILIAPVTTVYYDSGFLIGLKGFVGAIVGGLYSYPVAAAGAVLVGLLESTSSFWASAYKEVIVFTLVVPVLIWRSFSSIHIEEEE